MLKVFRDIRLKYYFISIIGACGIILLLGTFKINIVLNIFLAFVWVIFWALFFESKAQQRIVRINRKLNGCEVNEYIQAYEQILKENKSKQADVKLRLNLSTGYIENGEIEKAIRVLNTVKLKFKKNQSGYLQEICYYNDLFAVEIFKSNLNQASDCLEKMKELGLCLKGPMNPLLEDQIKRRQAMLDYHLGKEQEAFNYINEVVNTKITLKEQIKMSYYLGLIYKNMNQNEYAKQCFNFVIENGKESIYVKFAKEKMEKILESA